MPKCKKSSSISARLSRVQEKAGTPGSDPAKNSQIQPVRASLYSDPHHPTTPPPPTHQIIPTPTTSPSFLLLLLGLRCQRSTQHDPPARAPSQPRRPPRQMPAAGSRRWRSGRRHGWASCRPLRRGDPRGPRGRRRRRRWREPARVPPPPARRAPAPRARHRRYARFPRSLTREVDDRGGWTRSGVVFFFSAGTLIKLVYTASCGGGGAELRFAKFERRRMQECFDFVRAQGLVHRNGSAFFCAEFWLIL